MTYASDAMQDIALVDSVYRNITIHLHMAQPVTLAFDSWSHVDACDRAQRRLKSEDALSWRWQAQDFVLITNRGKYTFRHPVVDVSDYPENGRAAKALFVSLLEKVKVEMTRAITENVMMDGDGIEGDSEDDDGHDTPVEDWD